jgi:hypothetical protein
MVTEKTFTAHTPEFWLSRFKPKRIEMDTWGISKKKTYILVAENLPSEYFAEWLGNSLVKTKKIKGFLIYDGDTKNEVDLWVQYPNIYSKSSLVKTKKWRK